jgi:hypothetical protein
MAPSFTDLPDEEDTYEEEEEDIDFSGQFHLK